MAKLPKTTSQDDFGFDIGINFIGNVQNAAEVEQQVEQLARKNYESVTKYHKKLLTENKLASKGLSADKIGSALGLGGPIDFNRMVNSGVIDVQFESRFNKTVKNLLDKSRTAVGRLKALGPDASMNQIKTTMDRFFTGTNGFTNLMAGIQASIPAELRNQATGKPLPYVQKVLNTLKSSKGVKALLGQQQILEGILVRRQDIDIAAQQAGLGRQVAGGLQAGMKVWRTSDLANVKADIFTTKVTSGVQNAWTKARTKELKDWVHTNMMSQVEGVRENIGIARTSRQQEVIDQRLENWKRSSTQKNWNAYAKTMARQEVMDQKLMNEQIAAKGKGGIGGWFSEGTGKILKQVTAMYSLYAVYQKVSQATRFLFKTTMDLQTSFARIEALSISNGRNYSNLKNIVFSLGTAHGFLATEVAEAIKPLTQMGKSQEEITMLTEKSMQLANLTGDSLASVISSSIASMTNFDMSIKQQTELMDYWAALTSRFNVSIAQISKGFEQGGETFKEFGFNVKQVSAIMAVLMEQEQGKQAGIVRFLRIIMEQLPKPDVAMTIYERFGVSVLNKEGGQRDPWTILTEMASAWQKMDNTQKTYFRNAMANKSAMEAIYGVMNDWGKIQGAVNIGTKEGAELLDKQSKIMENTLIKQWVAFQNVWIAAASTQGQGFIKFLGDVLEKVTEISKQLNAGGNAGFWGALGWIFDRTVGALGIPGEIAGKLWVGVTQGQIAEPRLKSYGASGSWADTPADIAAKKAEKEGQILYPPTKEDEAAQAARKWMKDYAANKKLLDTAAKTRENNLKIAALEERTAIGYQVGINKQLTEEIQKRKELFTIYADTQKNINRLESDRDKAKAKMGDFKYSEKEQKLAEQIYEDSKKQLSEEQVKLAETNNAIIEQNTVARELGNTYRGMILDTMTEIIQKTQNWLDLNYKLRDLLNNIGNNVLRNVMDKMTGGFVDKISNLGGLVTGSISPFMGAGMTGQGYQLTQDKSGILSATGVKGGGMAGGADYTMVNGKLVYKPKAGGYGAGAYIGAGMMGAAVGSNRGTAGEAGGAAGAIAGMIIGNIIAPGIGAGVGAVAGGWLGSLLGKPKKDENKTAEAIESFSSTPSKIDVTNNELQIVNRNLIALKEKFDPYPFRESYYFTARANNAVGGGQWGNNITINIDGSKDPIITANAVSKAIAGYSMQGAQA